MDHDEYADEAIFDDLYDDEPANATAAKSAVPASKPAPQPDSKPAPASTNAPEQNVDNNDTDYTPAEPMQSIQSGVADYSGYDNMNQDYGYHQGQDYGNGDGNGMHQDMHNQMGSGGNGHYGQNMGDMHGHGGHGESGSTAIKEDGKMFIGGLNWETTDESLRDYFSQFGEVSECTVMRDGPSGRSRGFGFLTFKDPKTVNIVMVKEHYLDGKIIDPKRAIPRDEQERTSKIFVGGVSQDATEQDFREYFMQFGRVIDSTLMIDKETGRPRGFGFVTFDNEAAVDAALAHEDLRIHDKPIEVKKAQPRGNARDRNFDDDSGNRHGGGGGGFRDRGHHNRFGNRDQNQGSGGPQDHSSFNPQNNSQSNMANAMGGAPGANPSAAFMNGISPAMLAQYWQRMQQYMMVMMQQQQQMQMRGGPGGQQPMMPNMNMANFNPQMMAQMQQMQQMQGMPGGMPPMGMNGMPPQMGGPQGPNPQFNMNQQGGYQPKSPNTGMQQPYGGDNSGNGSQQDQKSGNASQQDPSQMNPGQQQQMGQGGMWNNMYEDPTGQGGMGGQGNNNRGGMPGGGGNFQNKPNPILNAPTGPKAGSLGPPPNAPTGPRNARNPPTGPSGGGPHRHQQRKGNQGFHPYQRG
ncbi:hypothetical protein Dda_4796 [Drechslerella dactyloides]|uniref:RRM domain-containing protein n=1 Tax=Drechslerella dactyloides TaxID=74499 RepID=A0AAD6IXK5_DREDA|nr:hypothetical protein Dda_4796 [Drechslerella dactyloides]